MSKRAVMLATRDVIRRALGYKATECEYVAGPEPPANCGDVFVAVHNARTASNATLSLDRTFSFTVTVTARIRVPWTWSQANVLADASYDAIEDRIEEIVTLVHANEDIRNAANLILSSGAIRARRTPRPSFIYAINSPPFFKGDSGEPQACDEAWFGAGRHSERGGRGQPCGMHMSADFGDINRLEPVEGLRASPREGS